MKERIAFIIKEKCKNKTEFAKRIKVSQAFVSQLCAGVSNPSDRTISDICREFGVDRVWLETGIGEPFSQTSRENELRETFADVLAGTSSEKNAFIAAIAQLPEEAFEVLVKSWIQAAEEMKKHTKKEE